MTTLDRRALADDYLRKLDHNQAVTPSTFEPTVKTRCICPNQGKPDADGYIVYSPSCMVSGHGIRTRYVQTSLEISLELLGGLR